MPWDTSTAEDRKTGVIGDKNYRSFRRKFTAAADGAIAGSAPIESSGKIAAVAYLPDPTTPPDTVTFTIKDRDGLDIIPEVTFPAPDAGRISISPPQEFVGGCDIAAAGNTVPGAEGTFIVYVE